LDQWIDMTRLFASALNLSAKAIARLPQRIMLGMGIALTLMAWPWLASRRRIAAINLSLCFPEQSTEQRASLLQKNAIATVTGLLELLRAWYASPRILAGLARIEGLEHVRQALGNGQGVLLLCGHFTHTELAARLLGEALGRAPRVVVRRHNNPYLERWLDAARRRVFGPIIAKKDIRGLLHALRTGEVVVYSADQNFTYQSAFVPFFGVPAATLTAVPDIVRRGRAQLFPFWFHRDVDGVYHLRVEPPWADWPSGDSVQDAARYMRELEAVVRAHPDQYLWMHQRFKTRPPGEPPIYR
jgi:KDO2-lipid IV(A) lauroyltransferase